MSVRALAFIALLAAAACSTPGERLVLGSTHTLDDSGLLEVLTAAFEEAHPEHALTTIVAGSGEILAMARQGDVDVLLTHSPDDEIAFIASGHGRIRQPVMHSEFLLLGPLHDAARAASAPDAAGALRRVEAAGALFVSRGDGSGTHRKERALWAQAQSVPGWSGYIEAAAGMADALRLADQRGAYILADRPTWEKLRASLPQLMVVHEGDAALHNPYSVIVASNAANAAGADAFATWIRSADAQRVIDGFGVDRAGRPLFTGDAP